MKQIAVHKLSTEGELYKQALELRYQLFFQLHGLARNIVLDDDESVSRHFAISKKQSLIAYGRLTNRGNGVFCLSQLVVKPQEQGKGYGEMMLRALIKMAEQSGAENIVLNARTTATSLYLKCGFIAGGEVFLSNKTAVPHIKMKLIIG